MFESDNLADKVKFTKQNEFCSVPHANTRPKAPWFWNNVILKFCYKTSSCKWTKKIIEAAKSGDRINGILASLGHPNFPALDTLAQDMQFEAEAFNFINLNGLWDDPEWSSLEKNTIVFVAK